MKPFLTAALLAACLCAPSYAEDDEPMRPIAATEAPQRGSAASLQEDFVSATRDEVRGRALEKLSKTPPTTARDVVALFDMFTRYTEPSVRSAVMDSLALIPKDSPQLEPLFMTYLRQPEPEAQLFGTNGAFRLRIKAALPMIREIAKRRFAAASAAETSVTTERNVWWTQYEALSVLAQWEGEKALPLLRERAAESPLIARLLAKHFWKQTLPQLAKWAVSTDLEDRERCVHAASTPIEPEDARATRAEMLALVRDPKTEEELRHQLALKAGAISTEAEAEALVKEHDAASDEKTRLLFAAAVFASRRDAAVPLLVRYARESEDPAIQKGAFAQLANMIGDAAAKAKVNPKK